MQARRKIGLLYGGRSGEHEISVRSARSVADVLDRGAYDLTLVGIDRGGRWHVTGTEAPPDAEGVEAGQGPEVIPAAGENGCRLLRADDGSEVAEIDVIFPVLHGPHGEDGTIQGYCDVIGVAYVGAGVLGSAIGMDKDVHKRLLRDAGIPIVPYEVVRSHEWANAREEIEERIGRLGSTTFVKPANLGSSVGISKVGSVSELHDALALAFRFDHKAVVERAIDAREIECAVLGNNDPRASLPGEIAPGQDFYSYDDKYSTGSSAKLLVPAPLSASQTEKIQTLAVRAFRVLELRGMARVDFFLDRSSEEIYLNEPNTLPGFTSISMYPRMWEVSGLSFAALVSELIELAVEYHGSRPG